MSFKNDEYIVIQGWMINELNLKGNDLLIYALIYRYSQDGVHKFYGSLQYLADWTNSTVTGVQNNLKHLIDTNLIYKGKLGDSKSSRCEYWVNLDIQQSCNTMQQNCNAIQQSCIDMQQSCNNNIINNKIKNNLFISKDINKSEEPEILQEDIYFSKHRTSRSFKVLQTWLTLYIDDDLEVRHYLSNWLTLMYNNKKIANLECLKNKIDYLYDNLNTREEIISAIKDASDKLWFTFQYSVDKILKNRYNIQINEKIEQDNKLELSDEVF